MLDAFFRILALTHKELLAILKDRRSRFTLLIPPILQCLIYGYVATYDLNDVPYAVLDRDRSAASQNLLARLDGIDFRQTAPVRPGMPFLRPYGAEWEASEAALSRPLAGIRPTMLVRAGALDQGNIGLNLADAEKRGLRENILFLAGSAINSLKRPDGNVEAQLGIQAMLQAIEVHQSGELRDVPPDEHLRALRAVAQRRNLMELSTALQQRYPDHDLR